MSVGGTVFGQRLVGGVPQSATHGLRVLTGGEFLDDVTEEARHSDRRCVDRTDQPARLDDRLTAQVLILQQRQPPAIRRPRQPPHLPHSRPIGALVQAD